MDLPAPEHRHLVQRVGWVPQAREWTGNENSDDQHHGLVSLNETPFFVRLRWRSPDAGRTVEVGTFKLSLRALAGEGFVQKKDRLRVRLRFARYPDGVVAIQANDSSPALKVGCAVFD